MVVARSSVPPPGVWKMKEKDSSPSKAPEPKALGLAALVTVCGTSSRLAHRMRLPGAAAAYFRHDAHATRHHAGLRPGASRTPTMFSTGAGSNLFPEQKKSPKTWGEKDREVLPHLLTSESPASGYTVWE